MEDEPFSHTQRFQQAIATTITCRSIIKYSSTLNDEQKNEVLTEIENTLSFLETRLAANASIESGVALSPEKLVDLLTTETEDEELLETPLSEKESASYDPDLKDLHKLYHTYLRNSSGRGLAALETRYTTVMGLLDQLQGSSASNERLLHRARGFVSAIYGMFREFAVLLSNIVEGKTIDTDTEALARLQHFSQEQAQQQVLRDITPLMHVYRTHVQLQEHRGTLTSCAREATAFLVFLEECLEPNFSRRTELLGQIKAIINLLNELARLLAHYEQAIAEMNAP